VPLQLLALVVRRLGVRGTLVLGAVAAAAYFFLPAGARNALLGLLTGEVSSSSGDRKALKGPCQASAEGAAACDFSRAVLGSTEDVWRAEFLAARLPRYGSTNGPLGEYQAPKLVAFARDVVTEGCGDATAQSGPFYCPADHNLYIDPSFYKDLEHKLRAPGDFAQAYVIAHEVGHHVQNLIGATRLKLRGERDNQASVRTELQADCLAGVWGHSARRNLEINDADLSEALGAAHAIGDDTLGHANAREFTHGTSVQRVRWFRRGFDQGDARQCDTFAVQRYEEL
jgi:uncharacterized protein